MPDEKNGEFGLKRSTIEQIKAVFSRHPQVERVILYGSRAKGNYRAGSDIDLTIVGNSLTLSDLFQIEHELDELLLPYKIDLSLFHQIDNPELLEHIGRVGQIFYQRI